MNVLVFNCGSSSLKYCLFKMPEETELAGGEAQRVGFKTTEAARIVHRSFGGRENTFFVEMADHSAAFVEVMKLLESECGPGQAPGVVAHRVVHGGGRFDRSVVVTQEVLTYLEATQNLAPIHNPPAIRLMQACSLRYAGLKQVAVFDTAFHATIPDYAARYPLPRDIGESVGIRKYGFHGISHEYVTGEAARLIGKPLGRFSGVSCHLGSGGASLCAVVNGRSVDNTMGFSPLQGLVMSTRCGDLDPAVALQLVAEEMGDGGAVEELLNKRSGVLGLSGISGDVRDVLRRANSGGRESERARRAVEVYSWRIRKYLGAYLAVVGSADAVIFTDTIGESLPELRWAVCTGMDAFGLVIDADRNRNVSELPADVAADDSYVRALVVHTNEELAIARAGVSALSERVYREV